MRAGKRLTPCKIDGSPRSSVASTVRDGFRSLKFFEPSIQTFFRYLNTKRKKRRESKRFGVLFASFINFRNLSTFHSFFQRKRLASGNVDEARTPASDGAGGGESGSVATFGVPSGATL